MMKLTIIGNGYTAQFLAKDALRYGYEVSIITRNISNPKKPINWLSKEFSALPKIRKKTAAPITAGVM